MPERLIDSCRSSATKLLPSPSLPTSLGYCVHLCVLTHTILGAQAFVGARELSRPHKGPALTRPSWATRLILLQKSSTATRCAVLGPHLHDTETSLPYRDATRPTSRRVPVVMPQLDPTSERGEEYAGESEGGRA